MLLQVFDSCYFWFCDCMILLLKKNSIMLKEWSDSTAFTHSFSGYMWIVLVTIRCGRWWHGCQISSCGAKKQKLDSFEKQLPLKFLFGYLATFWLFCNFFVPQIFLGEELRVVRVACPRHHKTRSGPPYSCVMLNEHQNLLKKEIKKMCKWNAPLVSCSAH